MQKSKTPHHKENPKESGGEAPKQSGGEAPENAGDFRNVKYSIVAITPRSTLALSSSSW